MPPFQSIFSMGKDYGAYGTPQQWRSIEQSSQDPRFGADARLMLSARDRGYVDPLTGGYGMRSSMPYQPSSQDYRYSMPFQTPTNTAALGGLLGNQSSPNDYFASLASSPQIGQSAYDPYRGFPSYLRPSTQEDAFYKSNYGMDRASFERANAMRQEQEARKFEFDRSLKQQIDKTFARSPYQAPLAGKQPTASVPPTSQSGPFNPGGPQYLQRPLAGLGSAERMESPSGKYGSQRGFFA